MGDIAFRVVCVCNFFTCIGESILGEQLGDKDMETLLYAPAFGSVAADSGTHGFNIAISLSKCPINAPLSE